MFETFDIEPRELTDKEKVIEMEGIIREHSIDMTLLRDSAYKKAVQDKTAVIVNRSNNGIQKFKKGEYTYITIPMSMYDELAEMNSMDAYDHFSKLFKIALAAEQYVEVEDDETPLPSEAELIDTAAKEYTNLEGEELDLSDLIEYDDYDQPKETKKQVFQPRKVRVVKKTDPETGEDKEEQEDAEDEGEGEGESRTQNLTDYGAESDDPDEAKQQRIEYQAQYTDQSLEEKEQTEHTLDKIKDSRFYSENFLKKKSQAKLDKIAHTLLKSFKGNEGRLKKMTPSKKMSSKDLCSDVSDRIYVSKDISNGKKVDMNIVIDCSGSMHAYDEEGPMYYGISLAYIFNKLAQEGYVTGSIILSSTSQRMKLDMPVRDIDVCNLGGTTGAEGLASSIEKYKSTLRGGNVLVFTDGDICDDDIKQEFWETNHINCVGMYINSKVPDEKLYGYDDNLKRWFPRYFVRNSLDQAIQKLIAIGVTARK